MQQRDEAWFRFRAGRFTSSRFGDLMARTKSGVSALRTNLIARLAVERITGTSMPTFQSAAMARGVEMEEEARQAYETKYRLMTEEIGIVKHPTLEWGSVSPDALVGEDGVTEFKCPVAEGKHVSALLKGTHVNEYWWQIIGLLWVTGRQWCDAVSFDPRFPEGLRLAVKRVYRSESDIQALEDACIAGNVEVQNLVQELLALRE
jgi:hypothetical protein